MKLPLNIAEKLLLLINGEKIPASKLKHAVIQDLISEGILHKAGKLKSTIQIANHKQLTLYLNNHFAITDLTTYIETCKKEDLTRADLVAVSSDSKTRGVRTFKGFLVNSYSPIEVTLNNEPYTIHPKEGSFVFIYDFETLTIPSEVTVIGIENSENFRCIRKQEYLFKNIKPLFVSRYPQNQSKDLIKWLQSIPNNYLHYGDFDFSGIGIYLNEFKKHLGDRASFFVTEKIDFFIKNFGSKKRYDEQKIVFDMSNIEEKNLIQLIDIIHNYKKGLDQEIFINELC